MSARILMGHDAQYALASPYTLAQRRKAGLEPRAELRVVAPHGKTERSFLVELDQDELCRLIAASATALSLLRAEGVDR